MIERFDAFQIVPNPKGPKDFWRKIGVAFANKDERGYRVKLTSMPVPENGEFVIVLREPLPPKGTSDTGGGYTSAAFDTDLDDDVPF